MSRELAYRVNDGLEVVLFWDTKAGDRVTVAVSDDRTGSYFELDIDATNALDAFNHPYAYAAQLGLPYDDALLPSWAQAAAA
jgi:hypothetical protein